MFAALFAIMNPLVKRIMGMPLAAIAVGMIIDGPTGAIPALKG